MTLFPRKTAINAKIKFKPLIKTYVTPLYYHELSTNSIKIDLIKTLFENPERDEIFIEQFKWSIIINPRRDDIIYTKNRNGRKDNSNDRDLVRGSINS